MSLLAYLPELGTLDRKQIAALAGVAPTNRDSGIMRGKRTVWGGRARVRAALYMGALVATRYNPVIRVFYQRLLGLERSRKLPWFLHAQAADHTQQHGEVRPTLGFSDNCPLTSRTVASYINDIR